MSASASQMLLTPERWSTWVAQRHEWNGFLWIRWPDAEAILLFVAGRPRIHLWDGGGWAEGEHALTAVAQRLERMHPPRWGQVALPARWASAIRDLALAQPLLPSEVVSPAAWVEWAQRTHFGGMAVLVGDTSAAWIVHEGTVRSVRFTQGAAVNGEGVPAQAEGLLQIYRGRVSQEVLPPAPRPIETLQRAEGLPPAPEVQDTSAERQSLSPPPIPVAAAPAATMPAQAPVAAEPAAAPAEVPAVEEPAAAAEAAPEGQQQPPIPVPVAPENGSTPTAQEDVAPQISPPAPAEHGESAVDQARSEASRRFRGDERFLLAPTVDAAGDAVVALAAVHGPDTHRLLTFLDGTRTLAEVAQAGSAPLARVEGLVAALLERRMVFRYTSRVRAPASSK